MPAVNCPTCREELDIPNELVGREVRCAACQNIFTVPVVSSRLSVPVVSRRAPQTDDDENRSLEDGEPLTSPRRKPGSSFGWILMIFGLLSCCGVGCGGFGVLMAIMMNPNFKPYTADDGSFTAIFPGKVTTNTDKTDDGQTRFIAETRRKLPPEYYYIQHVPVIKKDDAETILKGAADKSVKQVVGGVEMRRSSTTIDGYPAVDQMIEHGNGQQVTLVRHILVGKRLYTIGIVGTNGLDFVIDYVDKYFSGFQVKKKEGDAPAAKE
jgi:LSD1 subclass zinc finger protein